MAMRVAALEFDFNADVAQNLGCTVKDIINTVVITAIQAQNA